MSQSKLVLTFSVDAMNCGGCITAIKEALGQLDGVLGVDVRLPTKEVSVEFCEGTVTLDEFRRVIEQSRHWCFVNAIQKAQKAKRFGVTA